MKPVNIFIETKTFPTKQTNEERFIRYILKLLDVDLERVRITGTDGYTNLKQYKNQMLRNSTLGGENLVIFDSDFPET